MKGQKVVIKFANVTDVEVASFMQSTVAVIKAVVDGVPYEFTIDFARNTNWFTSECKKAIIGGGVIHKALTEGVTA